MVQGSPVVSICRRRRILGNRLLRSLGELGEGRVAQLVGTVERGRVASSSGSRVCSSVRRSGRLLSSSKRKRGVALGRVSFRIPWCRGGALHFG